VLALGVNTIVGSGIFRFPAELASDLGPASVLTFALGAALLGIVGLCFAELGSMIDRQGGVYAYAQEALGPQLGFAVGWSVWVATVLTLATVAVAIAGQLAELWPLFAAPMADEAVAAAVVLLLGALNALGRKPGALVGNLLVAIKVGALALFVVVGAFFVRGEHLAPFAPEGYAPLGPAMLLAFFALSGFETSAVPAGEAARAKRNVPRAMLGSLFGAALLYMLIQLVAIGVAPSVAASERPLADAARVFLGDTGARGMAIVGALSMLGLCTAMAFAAPRIAAALAGDGHLPEPLARYHPRFETPQLAVALGTALALALVLALDFRRLVDFTSLILVVQYAAACLAVIVLRRRAPDRDRRIRVPLGPVLPLAGLLLLSWVIVQCALEEIALGLGVVVSGFVLRALVPRPLARQGQGAGR
jgi:amino acid transporter